MINKAGNMIRLVRIFSLKMVFKSRYRPGFCEFCGFSRWSDISLDFKVWSTHCAKLGKSSELSWSPSASFSWCSQALSTLLNKTDLMRKNGRMSYVEKKILLHVQEVLRLHFVECIDSHDCRLQSSARGEILNCHWSMIRTLSNVLFPIEYAVKSIAGTRCLSWITLSTQSGFCDITSGLLNLIFPSFNPVQQKKMFVLSQAWVRWRAACVPSVASSSSPVRFPSWSPHFLCCIRSASTGNHKYRYKKIHIQKK